jgi:hypothetical protein
MTELTNSAYSKRAACLPPSITSVNNGTRGQTTLLVRSDTPYLIAGKKYKEYKGFFVSVLAKLQIQKSPDICRGLFVPLSITRVNNGTRGRT